MKKFLLFLGVVFYSTVFSADYYWVGNGGNWSDFANHWATTSGGNVFHSQVPTSNDNVYFDANSFTVSGQTISIATTIVYCKDMDWTGVLNTPDLRISNELHIYGSLTFSPNMTTYASKSNFLGKDILLILSMELLEVAQRYGSQDACIKHLENLRWNGNVECAYCKSNRTIQRNGEFRHQCYSCNRSFSVLIGTIMESTKLPLPKWFLAIALIVNAKKGISSLQLSRDIGVNKNTAWYLQKRIRQAMDENDTILKGIVEVDETYVGGSLTNKHDKEKRERNYDKSGMTHKTPVLGMIERKGKIVVRVLEKAWGKEIKPILKSSLEKSTELVTDGFGGYKDLHLHFKKHVKLNHSKKIRSKGKYNTNSIEGFWSMLKRAIVGQYHRISPKNLQEYLNEIAFKYNHRYDNNSFSLVINNLMIKSKCL